MNDTPDTRPGTQADAQIKPTADLVRYAGGARLAKPCECARRGYIDNDGAPPDPDVITCGTCGSMWCGRCEPTPSARCPFEYDHEPADLEPLELGCVFAGTSTRPGEETSALIVRMALERGWFPSPYGRHSCNRAEAGQYATAVLDTDENDTDENGTVGIGTNSDILVDIDVDIDDGTLDELAAEAVGFLDNQAQCLSQYRVVRDDGLHVVTREDYDQLYDD